ncbi:MAG: hypothetical protein HZA61_13790 [Candidatus Eisenbacteria bacterium]|uniref:Uncharacterized protein n=1 Tax=Eiseniibacteriota bacterium TaxID=2212470 RepID=A0A933SFW5_UNCEI|nr:hypothetical protein [Candidatus Eisenbacteria bacterium]
MDAKVFEALSDKVKSARGWMWKTGDPYQGPIAPAGVLQELRRVPEGGVKKELRLVLADRVPKLVASGCEGLRPGRVFHIILARLDEKFGLPDFDEETDVLGGLTSLSFEDATVARLCERRPHYQMVFTVGTADGQDS